MKPHPGPPGALQAMEEAPPDVAGEERRPTRRWKHQPVVLPGDAGGQPHLGYLGLVGAENIGQATRDSDGAHPRSRLRRDENGPAVYPLHLLANHDGAAVRATVRLEGHL